MICFLQVSLKVRKESINEEINKVLFLIERFADHL